MFSGIMELKNTILKIKEKKIKYGFEEKIIFSIGLIVFKNYSDRILNFLGKNVLLTILFQIFNWAVI
jgi:hypothetical protein